MSAVEAPCISQAGPTVEELTALVARLSRPSPAGGDAERIDRIVLLDMVQAAVAAASNVEITAFADSQLEQQRAAGISSRRFGQGIAEQIALARKVSPATGARQITRARTLTEELPETQRLLAKGEISDWVASIVVRETTPLLPADKVSADTELAAKLPTLSPRQAEATTHHPPPGLPAGSTVRDAPFSHQPRRPPSVDQTGARHDGSPQWLPAGRTRRRSVGQPRPPRKVAAQPR